MKLKANYVVIPLIVILTALLGSYFTNLGMDWYDTEAIKPSITPMGWIIGLVWNVIFVLAIASAIIFWNKLKKFSALIYLFILNAILNATWSFLFFTKQLVTVAFYEMIILELTTIAIIILGWKVSKTASLLLFPYVLWVGFATFLTYQFMQLN